VSVKPGDVEDRIHGLSICRAGADRR
jgi:hypothetical protein